MAVESQLSLDVYSDPHSVILLDRLHRLTITLLRAASEIRCHEDPRRYNLYLHIHVLLQTSIMFVNII